MTFWTPERVDQLKALFAEDLTAGQIHREMGAPTRCAVLGKLHRLGLKRDDSRAVRIVRMRQGIASAGSRREARSTPFSKPRAVAAPPIAPAPPPTPAPAKPCGLLELTNETCRWVVSGEGEPFLFCGALEADISNKVPYCPAHHRIAYRRPGEREEAA